MTDQDQIRTNSVPDRPLPGVAPGTQPATASRTNQQTTRQVRFDSRHIMIYREHQRAFTRQNGPAWTFEIRTPGRSSYPVIVSLTPTTTLKQEPGQKIPIATTKDGPKVKQSDA